MEKMTIRELAEALGCSKAAIRKHMTEEFRAEYTETAGNGDNHSFRRVCDYSGNHGKKVETIGNYRKPVSGNWWKPSFR